MSNINLITFLDAAQRTIIGELIEDNNEVILIKNPVVVNIVPQLGPNGQPLGGMALQLLPVYFKEFQGDKSKPAIFEYPKSQIVRISFEGGFDFRLYGQYEHIFNAPIATPTTRGEAAPVLKLFDDEK
ncbi:MAG: hypothetical protein PHS54_00450 [Clostridia bacterium]|nr:hypothetical protein [Clostridia bacterium]